ncbi:MAG: hypothetical protein ABI145_15685 [Steroidobacteraceae bacterium]
MSNVTRLPPFPKTVHVEADIPVSQRDEFDRAMIEIIAGARPRIDALLQDENEVKARAMSALSLIEDAINDHPSTGGARRLVRFLAGVYNGQDYPFDLTELRGLDTNLANACMDYLNYDRLGIQEVQKHLTNGDSDLHRWLQDYEIQAATRS